MRHENRCRVAAVFRLTDSQRELGALLQEFRELIVERVDAGAQIAQ
jgi:hypothetical protein